jgi:hypothetical protein
LVGGGTAASGTFGFAADDVEFFGCAFAISGGSGLTIGEGVAAGARWPGMTVGVAFVIVVVAFAFAADRVSTAGCAFSGLDGFAFVAAATFFGELLSGFCAGAAE